MPPDPFYKSPKSDSAIRKLADLSEDVAVFDNRLKNVEEDVKDLKKDMYSVRDWINETKGRMYVWIAIVVFVVGLASQYIMKVLLK